MRKNEFAQTRHYGKSRKYGILGIIIILLLLGVGGYYINMQLNKSSSPFPESITKDLRISLYYPAELPNGYSIGEKSFATPEENIFTFNLNRPDGQPIGVAEQPVPPDFNFNRQSTTPAGVRLPTSSFSTAIGQATLDQWGDKRVCYIVAGQTWIILNVTGLDDTQARSLARSFKPVK